MHRSVELDQLTVFAASGYDAALFQRTDGEHRSLVHVSRDFGDVVRAYEIRGKF